MRDAVWPTYEQVTQVPATWSGTVPEEYLDLNDHMNIQHYLMLATEAAAVRLQRYGLGNYGADGEVFSQFTAEHYLAYRSELRRGARVSGHARLIARSDRALHAIAYLVDNDASRVAFTMEILWLQVDMRTRRTTPFTDVLAALLDSAVADDATYQWSNPVSGVMGVR